MTEFQRLEELDPEAQKILTDPFPDDLESVAPADWSDQDFAAANVYETLLTAAEVGVLDLNHVSHGIARVLISEGFSRS